AALVAQIPTREHRQRVAEGEVSEFVVFLLDSLSPGIDATGVSGAGGRYDVEGRLHEHDALATDQGGRFTSPKSLRPIIVLEDRLGPPALVPGIVDARRCGRARGATPDESLAVFEVVCHLQHLGGDTEEAETPRNDGDAVVAAEGRVL